MSSFGTFALLLLNLKRPTRRPPCRLWGMTDPSSPSRPRSIAVAIFSVRAGDRSVASSPRTDWIGSLRVRCPPHENPKEKKGRHYRPDSLLARFVSELRLCAGPLPSPMWACSCVARQARAGRSSPTTSSRWWPTPSPYRGTWRSARTRLRRCRSCRGQRASRLRACSSARLRYEVGQRPVQLNNGLGQRRPLVKPDSNRTGLDGPGATSWRSLRPASTFKLWSMLSNVPSSCSTAFRSSSPPCAGLGKVRLPPRP